MTTVTTSPMNPKYPHITGRGLDALTRNSPLAASWCFSTGIASYRGSPPDPC